MPLWAGETAGDGSLDGETGQVTECLAVARSLRTVESPWPVLRQRKLRSDMSLIRTSLASLGSCQNVVSGVHINDHNARSQSTVTKYRVGGRVFEIVKEMESTVFRNCLKRGKH